MTYHNLQQCFIDGKAAIKMLLEAINSSNPYFSEEQVHASYSLSITLVHPNFNEQIQNPGSAACCRIDRNGGASYQLHKAGLLRCLQELLKVAVVFQICEGGQLMIEIYGLNYYCNSSTLTLYFSWTAGLTQNQTSSAYSGLASVLKSSQNQRLPHLQPHLH